MGFSEGQSLHTKFPNTWRAERSSDHWNSNDSVRGLHEDGGKLPKTSAGVQWPRWSARWAVYVTGRSNPLLISCASIEYELSMFNSNGLFIFRVLNWQSEFSLFFIVFWRNQSFSKRGHLGVWPQFSQRFEIALWKFNTQNSIEGFSCHRSFKPFVFVLFDVQPFHFGQGFLGRTVQKLTKQN